MSQTTATWGSATSIGLVRANNEDAVLADFPVFIVADGMGGAAAGEVASALASAAFRELGGADELSVATVSQAIELANRSVVEAAASIQGWAGMGTTLVGLALVREGDRDAWFAFNVGDSRLYRFYEGELAQVTKDHSEVQALIDRGVISAEEARSNPHRHVITRVVGIDSTVEPDCWMMPPVAGERFLICSDGLTGDVDDDGIAAVLASEPDPSAAAARLVETAVGSGGRDNITVVVVDVVSAGDGAAVTAAGPEAATGR